MTYEGVGSWSLYGNWASVFRFGSGGWGLKTCGSTRSTILPTRLSPEMYYIILL